MRLTGLVNDLLLLAQVDSGAHRSLQTLDLGQLTSQAVDRLSGDVDAPWIRLLAPGGVVVRAHRAEMERLLAVLLDNAAQYGGGQVEVTLRSSGEHVVLEVTDHGIGISDEDRESIFNEFYRSSDPVVAEIIGSGLGLSIAARIAERHQGRIDVRSTPGSGSTFTLTLPRENSSSTPFPFPSPTRAGVGLRSAGSPTAGGPR